MPQIVSIILGTPPAGADAFSLQFSADGLTWTPYSTGTSSPTSPENLGVELLVAGVYTLDGLNAPAGNEAAAAAAGVFYQARWSAGGTYGNWSYVFAATELGRGWPTGADVAALIATTGIALTAAQAALLDGAARAAAATWEDLTDLHPFLAAATDSTRRQHAPVTRSGVLLLDRPLATLTSVAYQPLGDTSTALVSPDEYLGSPINAEADGKPYWEIAFSLHRWGTPLAYGARGSLYVTGRWGYCTELPPQVWEGIRAQAALRVLVPQRFGATGGIKGWKDADRNLDYGSLADTLGAWNTAWGGIAATAATYRNCGL